MQSGLTDEECFQAKPSKEKKAPTQPNLNKPKSHRAKNVAVQDRQHPTYLLQNDQVEMRVSVLHDESEEEEFETEVQSQPLNLVFDTSNSASQSP